MRFGRSHVLVGVLFAAIAATSPAAAAELLTPAQEVRAAILEHPRILARFGGLYGDRELAAYVDEVGGRLAAAADDSRWKFHFVVIDNPGAVAFALAGGYVYISRTMIALANSEAEFAAVLAHEMSHIIQRHSSQREQVERQQKEKGTFPDAGALAELTRDQEFEADAYGVKILAAAGYDPMAQARFLQVVGDFTHLSNQVGLVANRPNEPDSHPSVVERIEKASAAATAVEIEYTPWIDGNILPGYDATPILVPESGLNRRETYMAAIDNIVFGPRPTEGLAVGLTFVDAATGFTFDLPPGFQFTRVDRTYFADGPGGASFRFDAQFRWWRSDRPMDEYLKRNVGRSLELDSVENIEINGMDAAIATGPIKSSAGPSHIYLAMVRFSKRTVLRFQIIVPDSFSETMVQRIQHAPFSLRILSDTEARTWAPLRLQVVTVNEDTTLESLAARMRLVDDPLQWLLAMNGLPPRTELAVGQKIKILAQ